MLNLCNQLHRRRFGKFGTFVYVLDTSAFYLTREHISWVAAFIAFAYCPGDAAKQRRAGICL
jgi:hypothetical protein